MEAFLLVLLLLVRTANAQSSLVCNANTALGMQFISAMYKAFPVRMTDECANIAALDQKQEALAGVPFAALYSIPQIMQRHDRCNALQQKLNDQAQNVNVVLPYSLADAASADLTREYTVDVDWQSSLLMFYPRTASTVIWGTVVLDANSVHPVPSLNTQVLDDQLFQLPDALFGVALTFAQDSFLAYGSSTMAPDLTFLASAVLQQASNPSGKLVRTQSTESRWGILMSGCMIPRFQFRIQWSLGSEAGRRRRLLQVACWQRTVTLVSVSDSGVSMQCTMPFTSNKLRGMLMTSPTRDSVLQYIRSQQWAEGEYVTPSGSDGSGSGGVGDNSGLRMVRLLFPASFATAILNCAQPAATGVLAGSWSGLTAISPGFCVSCLSIMAGVQAQSGMQIRACVWPLEKDMDCCAGCLPNYMQISAPATAVGFVCVQACKQGFAFSSTIGRCSACAAGLYSSGGLGQCLSCAVLVGDPNSWVDSRRGCQVCGSRRMVSGAACIPCPDGQYVPLGQTKCRYCEAQGYYVPMTSLEAVCTPCAPGTFYDSSSRQCAVCQGETYSSGSAATVCKSCSVGFYAAKSNKTSCLPCPPLGLFVEYFQPGCSLRCNPSVSYLRTSPYVPGGCGNCSALTPPIGTYPDPADCSRARPCTLPPNARFTSGGTNANNCRWSCNAGFLSSFQQGACTPCAVPANFNRSVHVFTSGCSFACRPKLYDDNSKACNQSCRDLLADYSYPTDKRYVLFKRVSTTLAQQGRPLPIYVLGVCGTSENVPLSDLPVLRLGRYAAVLSSASPRTLCGNSFLNTGETCDDGNSQGGDGCDATCQVETRSYWDCDLIGAPCLPNCGWTSQAPQAGGVGLFGYVLPACPSAVSCSCANMTYYQISALSPRDRAAWMASRLVPCDCGGNAVRTVPYAQCTAANRGCVACAAGQYFDDLQGQCLRCGSICMPGYYNGKGSSYLAEPYATIAAACGTQAAVMISNTNSSPTAQALVGCVPCPLLSGGQVYVKGCNYTCFTDDTSPQDNYYCSGSLIAAADGSCSGACLSCAANLQSLLVSSNFRTAVGYYPSATCASGVGYSMVQCDPRSKPQGALWTSNALTPGASTGCGWACGPSTLAWMGLCLPCFAYTAGTAAPCVPGQVRRWCGVAGTAACQPCIGQLPSHYQAWTSDPPYYLSCRADCESGVSFSPSQNGTECIPCSALSCGVGSILVPCTLRSDATCITCTAAGYPAFNGAMMEYIAAGSCQTRCVAGMYSDPMVENNCLSCVSGISCAPGTYLSSRCVLPEERHAKPTCLACPPLPAGLVWGFECSTRCTYGYTLMNGTTCVPCRPELCGLGYSGACVVEPTVTTLECIRCPALQPPYFYDTPGSCVAKEPSPPPSPSPGPAAGSGGGVAAVLMIMGGVARPDLQYPSRA